MASRIDVNVPLAYVSGMAKKIRDAIIEEYKRRGLNPYQLWKLVENEGVSRATVYAFINGVRKAGATRKTKTNLSIEHADAMMEALGLEINIAKGNA